METLAIAVGIEPTGIGSLLLWRVLALNGTTELPGAFATSALGRGQAQAGVLSGLRCTGW